MFNDVNNAYYCTTMQRMSMLHDSFRTYEVQRLLCAKPQLVSELHVSNISMNIQGHSHVWECAQITNGNDSRLFPEEMFRQLSLP